MGFEYFKSMLLLCKIFGNTEYSKDMKILGLLFRSLPTFLYHGQVETRWKNDIHKNLLDPDTKKDTIKSPLLLVTCLRWLWLLLDVLLRINILTLQSKYLFCDLTKKEQLNLPRGNFEQRDSIQTFNYSSLIELLLNSVD